MTDPLPPADPTAPAPLSPPVPPADAPPPPAAGPAPAPRRRRRWPYVVGGLLLLLGLLVLFLPAIAGTGAVRSAVVAQVNKNLNGRVQIDDWKLSWTNGLSVRGVRVLDAAGAQVAELGSVTTGLSLLDAAQGRYNLGRTEIDGANFNIKRYADGTTTFDRLVKTKSEPDKSSSPLPSVAADVVVKNSRGTFAVEAPPGGTPHEYQLTSIDATAKIPDINQPIPHTLKVVAVIDRKPPGTLDVTGTAGVVRDNKINLDGAKLAETIRLAGLDLSPFAAFLPPGAAVNDLRGVTDATFDLQLPGDGKATLSAQVQTKDLVAAGPAFAAGEKFQAAKLTFILPPTTVDMTIGQDKSQLWPLTIGGGSGTEVITLSASDARGNPLVNFSLAGRTNLQALLNVSKNLKPGSDGFARVNLYADAGKLNLSNTLTGRKGFHLRSGVLDFKLDAAYTAGRTDLSNLRVDVKDVAGEYDFADSSGVSLQPIQISMKGTSLGGGLQMPDLRDLSLDLTARGTEVKLTAPTLAAANGRFRAVLQELQADLKPLGLLADMDLKGEVAGEIKTEGNFLTTQPAAGQANALAATVTAKDLEIRRVGQPTVAEPYARLDAKGRIVGDVASPTGLEKVSLSARTGGEQNPLVVADLTADSVAFAAREVVDPAARQAQTVKVVTVPAFTINHLDVTDLPRAQAAYGAFVPTLGEWQLQKGAVALTGTGGYDGTTLRFGVQPRVNNLTLARATTPPGAATRPAAGPVLADYSLAVDVAGTIAGDAAGRRISLSQLAGKDNRNGISFAKAGAENLEINLPAAGVPRVKGGLQFGADLKFVNDFRGSLGAAPVEVAVQPAAAGEPPPVLRDGRVDGTVQFAPAADGSSLAVAADVSATKLTVGRGPAAAPVLSDEAVKLALRAQTPADFHALTVGPLTVTGSFIDAQIPKAEIALTTGTGADAKAVPLLDMVRQLSLVAKVDLPKMQALQDALSPPTPAAVAVAPTPAAAEEAAAETPDRVWLIQAARPVPAAAPAGEVLVDREQVPQAVRTALQGLGGGRRADVRFFRLTQDGRPVYRIEYRFTDGPERYQAVIAADGRVVARQSVVRNAPPVPAPAPVRAGADLPGAGQPPTGATALAPVPAPAPSAVGRGAVSPTPAAPPPAAPKPPAPLAKFQSGTAVVRLEVGREKDGRLNIAPAVEATGVTLAVGTIRHTVGDFNLKTRAVVTAAPPAAGGDKPLLDQIGELQIPELTLTGVGSTVRLTEPVILRDLTRLGELLPSTRPATAPGGGSAPPALTAAIAAAGDLVPLQNLLAALGGEAPKPSYFGTYELSQKLTTQNGTLKADGQAVVRDFVVKDDRGAETFREPGIRVANAATLDSRTDTLSLEKVTLAMESSKALAVDVTGRIADWSAARRFEGEGLIAKVTFDLERLTPIVVAKFKPVADPQTGQVPPNRFKDLKLVGRYTKQFALKGSFPADKPFAEAVKSLTADGGLTADLIDAPAMGLKVERLDIPVALAAGRLALGDAAKSATINGGKLNFGNAAGTLVVDLTDPHPRLSGPANLKLLENVNANTVFANFLGDFVNNPLLLSPQQASGVFNLTIEELTRLPIDARVVDYDPKNDGRAVVVASLSGVQLGNPTLVQVQSALQKFNVMGENASLVNFLQGDIQNYKITVEHGVTSHDMSLAVTRQDFPLRLYGNVRMADRTLMPLTLQLPPQLFKQSVSKYMPKGLELPLTGHLSAPQFDLGAALQRNLVGRFTSGNPADIADVIQGITGQGRKDGAAGGPASRPADPNPVDLLEGLLNKNKKPDPKPKDRNAKDR